MSTATLSRPTSIGKRRAAATTWRFTEAAILAGYIVICLAAAVISLEYFTRETNPSIPRDLKTPLWTITVGIVCNTSCAILGCYLVLRRMSLLGDAISHAVLPGIALAYLFSGHVSGIPILIGAMALGMLTSLLTQGLSSLGRVPEDASMGVVFTSLFALGVILIHAFAGRAHIDADCVLYGQIDYAGINLFDWRGWQIPRPLIMLGPALIITVAFVALFWKELKIVSFDPALAGAMGFRVALVHYPLMAVVSGVTVASFESVGSILVVAMLVVPAAAAALMADRLRWMMAWAVTIGAMSAIFGYILAVPLQTNVAGMMAVVAGVQFTLAVFLSPRYGLVSRWLRNLALAVRIASEDIIGQLYRAEERSRAGGRGQETGTTGQPVGGLVGLLARMRVAYQQWTGRDVHGQRQLTTEGRVAARNLVRAHRLWESYLDTHFDLPRDHLHDAAERMEHFIDPQLQADLDAELAGRATDPHGKQIPRVDEAHGA